ncbi:MAG: four helix bundle protein [Gemmatimonadetes bacterium]|nr:MAG: four helix bundle protein [Gemmatimonadota bacterium]
MQSYRELKVWQNAIELVNQIYVLTRTFPKSEVFGLAGQLRRAAVSIPSNIAEGWGRATTTDYIRFLRIARGSRYEVETQVVIARNLSYLNGEEYQHLVNTIAEIGKMLNGLISRLSKAS